MTFDFETEPQRAPSHSCPAPCSALRVDVVRCSACNKRYNAIPSTGKSKCPHCGERYYFENGEWHNEKCRHLKAPNGEISHSHRAKTFV